MTLDQARPSTEPGTLVRTGLGGGGRSKRLNPTAKEHIGTVDHHYGPRQNLTWVRDVLCGQPAGRAEPAAPPYELCGRCRTIAEKKGISVG